MEKHAPTANDMKLESLDSLLASARQSLQAGDVENAMQISDLFVRRSGSTLQGVVNATTK